MRPHGAARPSRSRELGGRARGTGIVVAALRTRPIGPTASGSEVSEGIALANELIPAVTEFFHRHGEVPPASSRTRHRSAFEDAVEHRRRLGDGRRRPYRRALSARRPIPRSPADGSR